MVVTSSRLAAVRYKFTIDKYVAKKGYDDIKALVAFSGTVIDPDLPGEEFTEPNMNNFPESVTEDKFATPEYQVMVVAEKYQTGFNQPLLQAMYVDKKLAGVNAVQTLGRLNRTHPGKDKTFVLDFVNDADTIQQAFSAYYDGTVAESTDPQVVYETWERLDAYHVIDDSDVDAFAAVWFDPTFTPKAEARASEANAALFDALRPAEERFADLDEESQDEVRQLLRQFTRQYAFLSQIVDYSDTAAEKRHAYCRMLADRVAEERGDALDLSDELRMTHYHVEKTHEGRIEIAPEDGVLPPTFTGGGYGGMTEDEQLALIDVIRRINERYGFNLDETHRLPLVV
jgi:type I restriction enzyme, R subunit